MLPSLTHSWIVPLLLLVPPLAWLFTRQTRGAWLFSDTRTLPTAGQRRARRARWGGLLLRVVGLMALILALAGPRWPDPGSRIPTEGIALAVVLDVSGSMAEMDFTWQDDKVSRLEGARKVLHLFIKGGETSAGALRGRPDDLLALVTFATRPETACPLTLDHQALLHILDEQEPRSAAGEATTNPGDALAWALIVLQRAPSRHKAIVFLTDGESNVPEGLKPRQAAQLAGNLGIPIYAIDAGPEATAPAEAEGAAKARAALQSVARLTNGAYFRARDDAALLQACSEIDRLQKDVAEGIEYRRYYEAFAWFALAALTCWTLALALEATRWRQVP
jgi:Ca-activated chloride channel family protein